MITHELGHFLGFDDDRLADASTSNVMAESLPLGMRRMTLPTLNPSAVGAALATSAPATSAAVDLNGLLSQADLLNDIVSGKLKRKA